MKDLTRCSFYGSVRDVGSITSRVRRNEPALFPLEMGESDGNPNEFPMETSKSFCSLFTDKLQSHSLMVAVTVLNRKLMDGVR